MVNSSKESIWKSYYLTSGKNFQSRLADYTTSHQWDHSWSWYLEDLSFNCFLLVTVDDVMQPPWLQLSYLPLLIFFKYFSAFYLALKLQIRQVFHILRTTKYQSKLDTSPFSQFHLLSLYQQIYLWRYAQMTIKTTDSHNTHCSFFHLSHHHSHYQYHIARFLEYIFYYHRWTGLQGMKRVLV